METTMVRCFWWTKSNQDTFKLSTVFQALSLTKSPVKLGSSKENKVEINFLPLKKYKAFKLSTNTTGLKLQKKEIKLYSWKVF